MQNLCFDTTSYRQFTESSWQMEQLINRWDPLQCSHLSLLEGGIPSGLASINDVDGFRLFCHSFVNFDGFKSLSIIPEDDEASSAN